MRLVISALVVALLALSGRCTPTEPDRPERRPGTLEFYGDSARIQVPDSVTTGTPFEVRVTTYGGGCMRKGEVEVFVRGGTVDIRPYDYEPVPGTRACPDILVLYNHTALVTLADPGEATIQVHGWKEPQKAFFTVTRSTIARPATDR